MLTDLLQKISPEQYPITWLLFACVLGYLFCAASIPSVLFVSHKRQLMDEPDERSSHYKSIPNLGGVAIFISLMLVITFIGAFLNTRILMLVMGALTILFFMGLKDDLAKISVRAKLLGQIAAILLLVIFTNTRILSFSGVFGLGVLHYEVSIVFTIFVFLLLINAINLIDGIDGLAGSVGVSSCFILGMFFYEESMMSFAVLAAAMLGALVAFLKYNFSVKQKLFMGDTGSLVIGFLLAFLIVSFINKEQAAEAMTYHNAAPILAFAVMFYPLADTIRIFFLRIFKYKRNPFVADRNHIHHYFTDLGYSHKRSTLYIVFMNLIIIAIAYMLKDLNINIQLAALLIYGPLLYASTFMVRKIKTHKAKKKSKS